VSASATGSLSSTSAAAGDVFVSPGVASGLGVTASGITLQATNSGSNKGGNLYVVLSSGSIVTNLGTVSLTGGVNGSSFSGVPTTVVSSISTTQTLTIKPTQVMFNAGGFTSITGGSLTIDTQGDSRLIVPIVARGSDTTLSGFTGANPGGSVTPTSAILFSSGNVAI